MEEYIIKKGESLLIEKDVATMLNVSERAMQRWRSMGRGPKFFRIEGCIRYSLADIRAYLEAGRTTA